MNDWSAIRAFYREAEADILEAGANEWGMDPYLWDVPGMLTFTPIESWLWQDIRVCDAVLYPQFPVGRFFVDFGNPVAKVAIECDGKNWHDEAKDAERDAKLNAMGWKVYRFPGWLCRSEMDPDTGKRNEALEKLRRICQEHGIDRASDMRPSAESPDILGVIAHAIAREAAILNAARAARSRA